MNIDPTLLYGYQDSKTQKNPGVLGKDDFLKLLVTELQMQDPLQPMEDKEFISQMATFTSLEQTTNMNDLLEKFVESQSVAQLGQQANMIGKSITWTESVTGDDGNTQTVTKTGIVTAVTLKDGKLTYLTKDGSEVDPSTINTIAEPSGDSGASGEGEGSA